MKRNTLNWRNKTLWIILVAIMVLFDQATKQWASSAIPLRSSVPITDWFNLVHVLNPGAAFSFLANAGGWQKHFFIGVGVIVVTALTYASLMNYLNRLEFWAATGITAGGFSNVLDRLIAGHVTDFLDFHWRGWHWPAFNFADVFIVCSVIAFLAASLTTSKHPRPQPNR